MRKLLNYLFSKNSPRVIPTAPPREPRPATGNGALLEATGLRVTHLRDLNGRDVTVAYKPRRSFDHNLEISTSIRNPSDVFSRKIGTREAVTAFAYENRSILIPPKNGLSDIQLIHKTFGYTPSRFRWYSDTHLGDLVDYFPSVSRRTVWPRG